MHGIFFYEFKRYVDTRMGPDAWLRLLHAVGLQDRVYAPLDTYPDHEAMTLIKAASELSEQSLQVLLEDFGTYIAPHLLHMFRAIIHPEWTTMDVLEHTERLIHAAVRVRNPGASPPRLYIERLSPEEVRIEYRSPRRLCAFGIGIVRGIARHFNEQVRIDESTCMYRGDPYCTIRVRKE